MSRKGKEEMETEKSKLNRVMSAFFVLVIFILTPMGIAAERKAPPKAEIGTPKAGQLLEGTVDVHLKLPEGMSGPVYAGLGGPPWEKLEQVGETNSWRGKINSRMVPNGEQKLIVKTMNKRADIAINVKVENPLTNGQKLHHGITRARGGHEHGHQFVHFDS